MILRHVRLTLLRKARCQVVVIVRGKRRQFTGHTLTLLPNSGRSGRSIVRTVVTLRLWSVFSTSVFRATATTADHVHLARTTLEFVPDCVSGGRIGFHVLLVNLNRVTMEVARTKQLNVKHGYQFLWIHFRTASKRLDKVRWVRPRVLKDRDGGVLDTSSQRRGQLQADTPILLPQERDTVSIARPEFDSHESEIDGTRRKHVARQDRDRQNTPAPCGKRQVLPRVVRRHDPVLLLQDREESVLVAEAPEKLRHVSPQQDLHKVLQGPPEIGLTVAMRRSASGRSGMKVAELGNQHFLRLTSLERRFVIAPYFPMVSRLDEEHPQSPNELVELDRRLPVWYTHSIPFLAMSSAERTCVAVNVFDQLLAKEIHVDNDSVRPEDPLSVSGTLQPRQRLVRGIADGTFARLLDTRPMCGGVVRHSLDGHLAQLHDVILRERINDFHHLGCDRHGVGKVSLAPALPHGRRRSGGEPHSVVKSHDRSGEFSVDRLVVLRKRAKLRIDIVRGVDRHVCDKFSLLDRHQLASELRCPVLEHLNRTRHVCSPGRQDAGAALLPNTSHLRRCDPECDNGDTPLVVGDARNHSLESRHVFPKVRPRDRLCCVDCPHRQGSISSFRG